MIEEVGVFKSRVTFDNSLIIDRKLCDSLSKHQFCHEVQKLLSDYYTKYNDCYNQPQIMFIESSVIQMKDISS